MLVSEQSEKFRDRGMRKPMQRKEGRMGGSREETLPPHLTSISLLESIFVFPLKFLKFTEYGKHKSLNMEAILWDFSHLHLVISDYNLM